MGKKYDEQLVTALEVAFGGLPLGSLKPIDVAKEAAPAAAGLRQSLRSEPETVTGEWQALATLLGRRLAGAGMPTTSASRIINSIAEIAAHEGAAAPDHQQAFRELALEGFTFGREDAVQSEHAERAIERISPIELASGVWGLVITGDHQAEFLKEAVDALGRTMFEQDCRVCVVDLTQLAAPNREKALALFGADEIAKMLGAKCFFVGVSSEWRNAADLAQIELPTTQLHTSMASALSNASGSGAVKEKVSLWKRFVDMFVG